MRKIALQLLLAAFLTLALLPSCNSEMGIDSDGLGDGQGISFVVGTEQYVFTENLGAGYTIDDDLTCVVASDAVGASAENAIHIYFPGNDADIFTGPPDSSDLPRIGILLDSLYYTWEDDKGCSFSINVTAYGPVGALIEGTFSGELVDGDEKIKVTDGVFSVMRHS